MSLVSICSIGSYHQKQEVKETPTISSFSSLDNGGLTLNPSIYSVNNYSIWQINNLNLIPVTNTIGTNSTGTFTLTLPTQKTVHIIIIGAGGSGGSGNEGGGGGSAGQFNYQSILLSSGTYNCGFEVGSGHGGASGSAVSTSTYSAGSNGYGIPGSSSSLVINGTTYTAIGGSPGGASRYNAGGSGAYGGGSGANPQIVFSSLSGTVGTITNRGGASNGYAGGGGGGSPKSNGTDGSTTNVSATGGYFVVKGGLGGTPIASTDSILANSPFALLNPIRYWCEGGHGACTWKPTSGSNLNFEQNITGVSSIFGLSGRSSGVYLDPGGRNQKSLYPNVFATNPTNHTGSGGSGGFQSNGLGTSTQYAPSGSNGLILIAIEN